MKKDQYISYFKTLGNKFIACGDYNAKYIQWGSRLTTPKGRQLYYAINELNLRTISPNSPTYWPSDQSKTPDLIDFCVSKGIPVSSETCFISHDLSSDHSPVFLNLHSHHIKYDQRCTLHNKKTNWCYFRFQVSQTINLKLSLKTEAEITESGEHLVQVIQHASWNATSKLSFEKPPVSNVVKRKISEKRKARKRWQQTKDKRKLNKATSELQKLLKYIIEKKC